MTTTLADLLAGVDMEGGENFCDSVYNFLKNQGKDINLLTNSGFGVWSQSDTNKGLGTMAYDNLAVAVFVVGEAITTAAPPAGSGATGKVISDIGSVLTLGACTGRFNDNEQITGAVSGTTADVNMPDAAVGVDLVRNGEFELGVGGWAGINCNLASIAGGQVGNCLEITMTAGASQYAHQTIIGLIIGKIYKITGWVKSGSSGNEAYWIYDGIDATLLASGISAAGWVQWSGTREAAAASIKIELYKATATAGTMEFDEVTCYEITPCCTAADNLAFDGWYKDATCDIYRQHWDATYSKCGSFYSLKIVPTVADDYVRFPGAFYDNEEWYKQFCGQPVTVGAWVYANVADHAKLVIQQTSGDTSSAYHTGTPGWEWLEVTEVIAVDTIFFDIQLFCDAAPNVDGTTIVYISQPMLVLSSSIGEGQYQPRLQEVILTEKKIPSNLLNGQLSLSDVAVAGLNLESDSDACLPKGIKEVKILTQCNDAASAGTDCYLRFRADVAKDYEYYNSPYGLVNDKDNRILGWQMCDVNGDIDYNINEAGGASGFDIDEMVYTGVRVN